MRRFRQITTIALVWATASSMLLASTPHYVCRCPDGTVKIHFAPTTPPAASCCSTGCCAEKPKQKSCCQPAKKQPPVTASCCSSHQNTPANPDGSPSINQGGCQKNLVQLEERTFCRIEIKTQEASDAVGSVLLRSDFLSVTVDDFAARVWRIDKAPPPTDLVSVLQRLTI